MERDARSWHRARAASVALWLALAAVSGCMAPVRAGKVPSPTSAPAAVMYAAPTVALTVREQLGTWLDPSFREAAVAAARSSNIFRPIIATNDAGADAAYLLVLEAESTREAQHVFWDFMGAVFLQIGCITPYGVPFPMAKERFTLHASLYDSRRRLLKRYRFEDDVTWWCGPAAMVALPFVYPASERIWDDMLAFLWHRMANDRVFAIDLD